MCYDSNPTSFLFFFAGGYLQAVALRCSARVRVTLKCSGGALGVPEGRRHGDGCLTLRRFSPRASQVEQIGAVGWVNVRGSPFPSDPRLKRGASPAGGGGASRASLAPHCIMIRGSCTHLHGAARGRRKKKSPCITSTADSGEPGSSPRTIAEIPTTLPDSATPALLYMQGTVATPVPACWLLRFRRAGAELGGLFLLLR